MSKESLNLGKSGEILAQDFLKQNGYRVIKKNYKTKLGEVDIIAYDKGVLCFVEVKARSQARFGLASEAVSPAKQRQVSKAALVFLKENKFMDKKARFDVVCVDYSGSAPRLDLLKNAFELDAAFTY